MEHQPVYTVTGLCPHVGPPRASDRKWPPKWPQVTARAKWPQVTAAVTAESKWPQVTAQVTAEVTAEVTASDRKWPPGASDRKWPQVTDFPKINFYCICTLSVSFRYCRFTFFSLISFPKGQSENMHWSLPKEKMLCLNGNSDVRKRAWFFHHTTSWLWWC